MLLIALGGVDADRVTEQEPNDGRATGVNFMLAC